MMVLDKAPTKVSNRINELKVQQDKCTRFILDCITVREQFPQYAERIDDVISTVESVMSENADLLARLEAEARSFLAA